MKEIYTIDESYFEEINTPNKAYFLGLLYADGNINKRDRVIINLQERDCSILEKLRVDIKLTKSLEYRKREFPRQNQRALCFYNHKIASDLRKLGLHEKKTKFITFPDFIDNELMIHFIRGFFDGDGWISRSKRYAVTFGIICLDNFAQGIVNFLKSINIEASYTYYKDGRYSIKNIVCVNIRKKKEIFKLMTKFYENTNLYIERKHTKYVECFINNKLHLYERYTSNSYTGRDTGGGKSVFKLDIQHNIVKKYPSMLSASRDNSMSAVNIKYHCNKYKNKEKYRRVFGFTYCYEENYNPTHLFAFDHHQLNRKRRRICQMDKNGNVIKNWEYIKETLQLGFDPSTIVKCCKGKFSTHKGYKWKYIN